MLKKLRLGFGVTSRGNAKGSKFNHASFGRIICAQLSAVRKVGCTRISQYRRSLARASQFSCSP